MLGAGCARDEQKGTTPRRRRTGDTALMIYRQESGTAFYRYVSYHWQRHLARCGDDHISGRKPTWTSGE